MPRHKWIRDIEDVAKDRGYQPADFLCEFLSQQQEKLCEWKSYLDAGATPPELGELNMVKARRVWFEEAVDFVRMETQVLPYFYGKKSSVDVTGSIDVGLADILVAMNDASGTESGS